MFTYDWYRVVASRNLTRHDTTGIAHTKNFFTGYKYQRSPALVGKGRNNSFPQPTKPEPSSAIILVVGAGEIAPVHFDPLASESRLLLELPFGC